MDNKNALAMTVLLPLHCLGHAHPLPARCLCGHDPRIRILEDQAILWSDMQQRRSCQERLRVRFAVDVIFRAHDGGEPVAQAKRIKRAFHGRARRSRNDGKRDMPVRALGMCQHGGDWLYLVDVS